MIRVINSEDEVMEMEKYFKGILFKKPARRDGVNTVMSF
jgi:hypothetical protein